MEDILVKLPEYIESAALVLAAVVVLATVLVRLTPKQDDDRVVSKFGKMFFKFLKHLPTVGINPQTKKLEEAYDELKPKDA